MKITNSKKTSDGVSYFLIIFTIVLIFVGIQLLFDIPIANYDIPFILFILLFFVCPSLFFIDIIIWRLFGKEIIYINEDYLVIIKINRLFIKRKKIKLKTICFFEIVDRSKYGFIAQSMEFWDFSYQGFIHVKYSKHFNYYFGENIYLEDILLIKEFINNNNVLGL